MKRCITKTRGYSRPGSPYSPAVVAEGRFVFVSGQGPLDPKAGKVVRGTVEEQVELTLRNVSAHLAAAGARMEDVVQCRVFLSDCSMENWQRMNGVYRKWFPKDPPARTTIGCQLLGMDVEIDATAVVGRRAKRRRKT